MFKKGDIVVCIDNNERYGSYDPDIKKKLTIDKNYIVIDYKYIDFEHEYAIVIINDMNKITGYKEDRFINLKEYRKRKLNKLSIK